MKETEMEIEIKTGRKVNREQGIKGRELNDRRNGDRQRDENGYRGQWKKRNKEESQ